MFISYKNIKIHYTVIGEGSAIILLHGLLGSTEIWSKLLRELAKKYQVLCIDLLGHGKTDCFGYMHTMEDMAGAVYAVLKHHKIKEAVFIGHSMGGYVALALANSNRSLFKGLCLMNSTFEADNEVRKKLRTRAIEMARSNYKNLVRMSFANLFAPKSKETYTKEYENALKLALQTPVQGYIAAQEGMKLRSSHFETIKALDGKACIITGKKDSLINSKQLYHKIKNTTISFVEFSEGHMSYIENKSELSYFILRFVEKQYT